MNRDLLRFLTCGGVDDGKSTLIGRLLHDTQSIYADQLAAVVRDSGRFGTTGAGNVDLALLTDGLKAEREQGITIDVAYRYFSTERRTFIIADTPGHEQYTRNMATGASTCQLAVLLVDARRGVLTQTRRHSFIAALLGIRHVVVAVNKMDLVGYAEDVFDAIRRDYAAFAARLDFADVHFIPISALMGDNVVAPSAEMPWYDGPSLLAHLETVPIARDDGETALRFPVQHVIRAGAEFRGYAGTIASGVMRSGDEVVVLPSGRRTAIESVWTPRGEGGIARAGMSVTVTLRDELDVSRGDWLVHSHDPPCVGNQLEAMVVWMGDRPLASGRRYWIKHTTRLVPARIDELRHRVDVNTLERCAAAELAMNEVGLVSLTLDQAIPHEPYATSRVGGAFILIDRLSNDTVGAGMITASAGVGEGLTSAPDAAALEDRAISPAEREARLGQKGMTVLLFGHDAIGRAVFAGALERRLFDEGLASSVLDAESLRRGLSRDLGDSAQDAAENLRRGAEVARLLSEAGLICIVGFDPVAQPALAEVRGIVGGDRCVTVRLGSEPGQLGRVDVALGDRAADDDLDRLVHELRQRARGD